MQGSTPRCGDRTRAGDRDGEGSGSVQGQGRSGAAMCPWVNMEAPGVCSDVLAAAAPEGRPPSLSSFVPSCSVPLAVWEDVLEMQLEMAAALLTASAGTGRRESGTCGGAGVARGRGVARGSWSSAAAWLRCRRGEGASAAPHWCWPGGRQRLRLWPGFDGLGSAFMFRLETARLG